MICMVMRLQSDFGRSQLTLYEPVQTEWTGPQQLEGNGLCQFLSVQSGFGKMMTINGDEKLEQLETEGTS
jgi:hypothetical protein